MTAGIFAVGTSTEAMEKSSKNAAELAIEALSYPAATQAVARELALRSDLSPEEVEILRGILVPWWETERNAEELCSYLGTRAATAGHGSPAHRTCVLVLTLAARTVLHLNRTEDQDGLDGILEALVAWALGQAPEADLASLRIRAWNCLSVAENDATAADAIFSAIATVAAVADAADAAKAAIYAAKAAAADAAKATAFATTSCDPAWTEAKARHLSEMAEMIRLAIPACPLGEP